jgi:hypothetical protein
MHLPLIVVALIGIILAQDALASQTPNSRSEMGDTIAGPQTTKAQSTRAPDMLESNLVGRLYTLTYGGRELCEKVGLEEAAQFERVLDGFQDAFPEVMQQLEQSSYFELTKSRFSLWVQESQELEAKDEVANLCLAGYKLLKAYTDNKHDSEVVESVLRIHKILKH